MGSSGCCGGGGREGRRRLKKEYRGKEGKRERKIKREETNGRKQGDIGGKKCYLNIKIYNTLVKRGKKYKRK